MAPPQRFILIAVIGLSLCGRQAATHGDETSQLEAAFPPTGETQVIDLETAWRLTGVQNPGINRAKMLVEEAEALQRQAVVVWLPNASGGANYRHHNGNYQSSFGQIREVDMSSFYAGAGSFAVGGGSPTIAGLRLFTQTADALYEPLAAKQNTAARCFEARAVRNSTLLDVTVAYLELMSIESRIEAVRRSHEDFRLIVEMTDAYAKTGQGRLGDTHRAEAEIFLLIVEFRRLEEELSVRAAELSRLLHLDPTTRLQTPGGPLRTYDLVDLERPLPELLDVAMRWRPEPAARTAFLSQSRTRVSQERARPLLPTLSVGYSVGGFGGTGNLTPAVAPYDHLHDRCDFDVWAFWTLQNVGFGNLASVDRRKAELDRRAAEREQARNQIRTEVSEAYASALIRRRQLAPALRRLHNAESGFQADHNRLRAGEGLPLEVLNHLRLLAAARQELVTVVVADTIAQFRLFTALGQPAYGATRHPAAGEIVPDLDAEPMPGLPEADVP